MNESFGAIQIREKEREERECEKQLRVPHHHVYDFSRELNAQSFPGGTHATIPNYSNL